MPELAEVEYFRKQWDVGLRQRIRAVALHGSKRIFRGSEPAQIQSALAGATFVKSETKGKQMLFHFSRGGWLGLHLGMSGELRVESSAFEPGRHDHLVLHQAKQSLVFRDPRMFGRVRFHQGKAAPDWWTSGPPSIGSKEFSARWVQEALARRRVPIKAALLAQELFAGVGNWMADEILWRARLHPKVLAADLNAQESKAIWRETRAVAAGALKTIGVDWSDPPQNWLIHVRWKRGGLCPRDSTPLRHETVGGRTTAWCPVCQKGR